MIKRIKIRDFKSIRELDLKLDPVTVLVGRSGTGKSNLVQAIRFVRNLLLNYEEAINYESGWERIVPVGEQKPRPSFELFFSIPGDDSEYSYLLVFGRSPHNNVDLQEERLSLAGEVLFSRMRKDNQWGWTKAPSVSPVPPPHADHPIIGKFPSLQQVVFANAALATGIGY